MFVTFFPLQLNPKGLPSLPSGKKKKEPEDKETFRYGVQISLASNGKNKPIK